MTEIRPALGRPFRPSSMMRLLIGLAPNIRYGSITFVLPDGSQRRFAGPEAGPDAVFCVHDQRVARRFLIGGTLGFCESYLDGDWSSPDMEALFVTTLLNGDHLRALLQGHAWYRVMQRLLHLRRGNDRSGARRNIAHHYDLGNGFYRTWLDPSMTYSAALFDADTPPTGCALTTAQRNKYAAIARRAGIEPGHRVLEIGCGWGGFAEFAAAEVGAQVTAVTISREQYAFARERIFRAGLADRVDIRLQDYRDVDGTYDRVASIEMFEAVGEAYWPTFFATLRDRLAAGGSAALQVITIADSHFERYRRKADYIQKYIFPGGMLPSPGALRQQLDRAGLQMRDMTSFGADYARTLREWNRRFQQAWPELQTMGFDARFKRMWEQYLHYCTAGFAVGTIDVVHLAVTRD
ncbi:MAG: class I SAM-dependent methyltransferase [Inquilinaceae bacterium]